MSADPPLPPPLPSPVHPCVRPSHRPDRRDLAWAAVPARLAALAEEQLPRGAGGLWLAAGRAGRTLLVATSRGFPTGGHARPVLELAALGLGLGADALAVAVRGRAWSLDQPVVRVPGAPDGRQRVLCTFVADGQDSDGPVVLRTVVRPYDLEEGALRWGVPVEDAAEGWLAAALPRMVAWGCAAREPQVVHDQVRQQHLRCLRLGHVVTLTPAGVRRLAAAPA